MTIHNQLGQFPGLLRGYLTATGLLENEEGVVRLGETLTPVIDLWRQPEWALLRGEQHFSRRTTVAAGGAGTNAAIGLGNPANSGIVAVAYAIMGAPQAAGTQLSIYAYSYATATGQWGNTAKGVPKDRRRIGLAAASIADIIVGNTPVGIPAGGFELEVQRKAALDTYVFLTGPYILYAGDAIMVLNNTVANGLDLSLAWYERKCVTNEARGG